MTLKNSQEACYLYCLRITILGLWLMIGQMIGFYMFNVTALSMHSAPYVLVSVLALSVASVAAYGDKK